MKRILDEDKDAAITTVFHYNNHDDTFQIETKLDVSEIVKDAKTQANETDKHTRYGEGVNNRTKVASIPMSIYYDWVKKGYTKDQKKMKQLLNSPDLRHFRTRAGKV